MRSHSAANVFVASAVLRRSADPELLSLSSLWKSGVPGIFITHLYLIFKADEFVRNKLKVNVSSVGRFRGG